VTLKSVTLKLVTVKSVTLKSVKLKSVTLKSVNKNLKLHIDNNISKHQAKKLHVLHKALKHVIVSA